MHIRRVTTRIEVQSMWAVLLYDHSRSLSCQPGGVSNSTAAEPHLSIIHSLLHSNLRPKVCSLSTPRKQTQRSHQHLRVQFNTIPKNWQKVLSQRLRVTYKLLHIQMIWPGIQIQSNDPSLPTEDRSLTWVHSGILELNDGTMYGNFLFRNMRFPHWQKTIDDDD